MSFVVKSDYQPSGDQPQAIEKLSHEFEQGTDQQVLLGVTGSGKTFTMANVIAQTQLPTLVIAHNKTLAAQLYQEFRDFFPNNAVSYFVSYYDYYQPEAYIPSSDTYIEKEATINDEIDKLRLAATTNLLTRRDAIVVASVSCIYNLGSPVEYGRYLLRITAGEILPRKTLLLQLANLQYERSDTDLHRGSYRLRGERIQVWPAYEDTALNIDTLEDRIVTITRIDPISGQPVQSTQGPTDRYILYPAKHYVVNPATQESALAEITHDLEQQVAHLEATGKPLEAYRLKQRVTHDMEMIKEFGFVNGIENYSRYFDGRQPGDPPFSLLDYFQENARLFNQGKWLTIIDESHITVPQVRGMFNGDQSRKQTLIDYGFRLPSARDNRPLQFHEFQQKLNSVLYVSATPQAWEVSQAKGHVVEQLVRPTGLLDPEIELRPIANQIEDLVVEIMRRKQRGQRTIVTTLTKRTAEALTEYLNDHEKMRVLLQSSEKRSQTLSEAEASQELENSYHTTELPLITDLEIGKIPTDRYTHSQFHIELNDVEFPKVAYLHSDVETLDRSDILDDLRRGTYDVVVGINLLREGLDLPEVTLVAILDADKEGFLRSTTALIQTIGRAARHNEGRVILYADKMTRSMREAVGETYRRREIQIAFNLQHQIMPQTINKPIREKLIQRDSSLVKKRQPTLVEHDAVVEVKKGEFVDIATLDPASLTPVQTKQIVKQLRSRMRKAADAMDFELATVLRDTIARLENNPDS